MGVGKGDNGLTGQRGHPPIHFRIAGQSRFHRMNIRRHIPKTLLQGVEPGLGAEHPIPGSPDVSWDHHAGRVYVKQSSRQVPGRCADRGPAVAVQLGIHPGHHLADPTDGIEIRGENQQVHPAGAPPLLVHAAEFRSQNESHAVKLINAFPRRP